jgi:hypothetical protein
MLSSKKENESKWETPVLHQNEEGICCYNSDTLKGLVLLEWLKNIRLRKLWIFYLVINKSESKVDTKN